MKKYSNNIEDLPVWKDYLFEVAGNEYISKEKRAAIRKEYKKLYCRKYRLRNKGKQVRIVVTFDRKLYKKLDKLKGEYGIKAIPSLVKAIVLKQLEGKDIVSKADGNKEIAWLVRKAGNNINQIVHKIHQEVKYKTVQGNLDGAQVYKVIKSRYEFLVKEVMMLEQIVKEGKVAEHTGKEVNDKPKEVTLRSVLGDVLGGDEMKVETVLYSIERLKNAS